MKTPVSPKVTASAVFGALAALLLANVTLITPDLFSGLGKWSGLVYGLTIAGISVLGGWLKTDPLRQPDTPPVVDHLPDLPVVPFIHEAAPRIVAPAGTEPKPPAAVPKPVPAVYDPLAK